MKISGKYWSIGAIYDIPELLTGEGYLKKQRKNSRKERKGKRRNKFRITNEGFTALQKFNKKGIAFLKSLGCA